ncbi:MAG: hypothetical protein AB1714_23110 [Acidobacteriota bacterium]
MDEETRRAARELALRYGCSTSEAIRRAVLGQRDTVFGVPSEMREQRKGALERLFRLFRGNDAKREVARLKSQDLGF